jgi:hypothetical protein
VLGWILVETTTGGLCTWHGIARAVIRAGVGLGSVQAQKHAGVAQGRVATQACAAEASGEAVVAAFAAATFFWAVCAQLELEGPPHPPRAPHRRRGIRTAVGVGVSVENSPWARSGVGAGTGTGAAGTTLAAPLVSMLMLLWLRRDGELLGRRCCSCPALAHTDARRA